MQVVPAVLPEDSACTAHNLKLINIKKYVLKISLTESN
jgi:hypothetical protein